ncbi:MAG: PilZ domain-containing protein, partial [Planctomycetota bacterium]
GTIEREVRCRVGLPDGTILEGIVENISQGGAGISGPTTGLSVGDEINLVFVFLTDEEVAYRGIVRRIDPGGRFFGLQFTSDPQPIKVNEP